MLSLATGHAFELESPQSWDEKDKNWNIISCSEMHKNNSLYGCSLHRTDSQFSQAHIINEYFILAFVWKMACTLLLLLLLLLISFELDTIIGKKKSTYEWKISCCSCAAALYKATKSEKNISLFITCRCSDQVPTT